MIKNKAFGFLTIVASMCLIVISAHAEDYSRRYPLRDAKAKLLDDRGKGFEPLYGLRNFRAVLSGSYYRGGANNSYHRDAKRSNKNPLPDDGLQNLCEEGFATAIYLYPNNFSSAPEAVDCKLADGSNNRLRYIQVSILTAENRQLRDLLILVRNSVGDRPIYAHCWSGWHASGLLAAYTLKQFCGFSGDEAVAYWNVNADGRSGSSYDYLRSRIRAFQPFPDLKLTNEERDRVCPNPVSLRF